MDTKQWLSKLISFDTTSRNSNLSLIESIATWFDENGVPSHIIPGNDSSKANLFATLPNHEGKEQGGIVLSGHTDTVPVDGQIWHTDPFSAVVKDNKIYGRGASDMKGFIAVMLALLPELKPIKLHKPVHFSFTCDEEIGCLGAPHVLSYLKQANIQPEACIIGEPSSMLPIVGYKGRQVYHIQIKGLSAHSSLTNRGCNAIEYGSRLICYIRDLADFLRKEGPFDADFDVPFTSITTNIVSGGHASNVIPANCEFMVEMRYLPQFSVETVRSQMQNYINETLLPEMRQTYPGAEVYLNLISDAPGFTAHENALITTLLRHVTGINKRMKVSYSTEAGIFQRANIPTIICGPGSIEQAHQADEFITLEQLAICEKVLRNTIKLYSEIKS
ncbi:acetylornithine deacetylase [Legionella septentrionalis]|uniref:acetylornithine deacetylase n=1 Tax=Legionella septentrionalis TaxID=2498109 RepID=UPI000F8E2B36|nr:acetylornithine deacetylase [Legionella septentrionalis]RUQ94596.1 acetylornithine deacetylase [Legionella septentrionalis]RUR08663.1 acetylornithine deacetylase [Legionella septentrionalis]